MTTDTLSAVATILLVDADDCTATHLQENLLRSGYTVRLASSAESALAALAAEHADLILLDLLLPDADGLILCSTLSARTSAPIIMLSARGREVDRLLAVEVGARALVTKPVDVRHLLPLVKAALAVAGSVEQMTGCL